MSLGDKFQKFFYLFFKIHFWPRKISATYPPTYKGGIKKHISYQFTKIFSKILFIVNSLPSTYKHAFRMAIYFNHGKIL